jgi:predicted anti-sigma-YlaC factor YlaD
MKCTQIGEQLMDMAAGVPVEAEVEAHLHNCAGCTERLESLRQTMNLLDEWQAPEPSPYFDVRLQARLREEAARPKNWVAWLRKPVLALAMVVLLAIGGMLVIPGHLAVPPEVAQSTLAPGTAVGDLQTLDRNPDLLANFDLLDDVPANEPEGGNP